MWRVREERGADDCMLTTDDARPRVHSACRVGTRAVLQTHDS